MGDLLTSLSRTRQLRIQVVAERFFFPWAFLFDGDDDALAKPSYDQFWGFKHVIEYLPEFTAGNLINFNPTITVGDTVDMAFVCNNTIDTQFGEPVVQGQRDYFSTLPGISVQDYPNVADLVRLMRGPDSPLLIYFYCHAISKQTGEDGGVDFSRISLSDAKTTIAEMKLKTRSAVERLRQAPLVFLNACESAELSPFLYDGWVPFLLSRGVRGVLGTEVETPAFFGADFAKEFIQRFMTEEQPIGTLLLSLKQAYVEQRKNILGILFVMYANGDIVLSRNKKSSSNEDSIAKSSTNNTNLSTAKVETAIAHSNPDSSSSALASVHSVLLDMLEKLEAVDLPVDDLEDLRDDLRLAIRAITREHPNSQRAADKLFSMSETIKKLKERYPELQSFESTINTAIGLLVSSPNI